MKILDFRTHGDTPEPERRSPEPTTTQAPKATEKVIEHCCAIDLPRGTDWLDLGPDEPLPDGSIPCPENAEFGLAEQTRGKSPMESTYTCAKHLPEFIGENETLSVWRL